MTREIPWPDAHIRRALADAPGTGRRVVLLMTGALNPTHLGHIAMMQQARRFLAARGDVVLGGWLSPSNDHYVQAKYARRQAHAYSAAQRRAMCRAPSPGGASPSPRPHKAPPTPRTASEAAVREPVRTLCGLSSLP